MIHTSTRRFKRTEYKWRNYWRKRNLKRIFLKMKTKGSKIPKHRNNRAEFSEERRKEISERMRKYWADTKTNKKTTANKWFNFFQGELFEVHTSPFTFCSTVTRLISSGSKAQPTGPSKQVMHISNCMFDLSLTVT